MLALTILMLGSGRIQSAELDLAQPTPLFRSLQEDAELTDVAFADPQRGWAVGDRGVIWCTQDGGRHWRLQNSGVTCRLESVQFMDTENGWVAGGLSHPYTHTTRGVLLRTRDGGRTWIQDKGLVLPALKRVRFFNGAQGWAIGEPSALFPSCMFTTENGGRTWAPVQGVPSQGWLAADMIDPLTGAAAGRSGVLAAIRRKGLEEARTPSFGLRWLRRLKLTEPAGGWLIGDGGLVLTTADLGLSWQTPRGDPAEVAGLDFDWRALEVRSGRVWVAGSPGTRVLHTADGGQSWQTFATGQSLPLHSLTFIDDQQGWAVGALGTILATSDGGQTWSRQHSGGTRAALAAFFDEPQRAPLELFAHLSADEGYLSSVQFLARRDQEPGQPQLATLAERSHAALVAAGASNAETAWAFPLRQNGLSLSVEQIVDGWNRAHDGAGIEQLEALLVRSIRCWRPDVVLTHAASPRGNDPLGHLLNQVVLRAVEQAADGSRLPDQLSVMGLEPWQVKKVFGSLPPGQLGSVNITASQLAPRLGLSLADYATAARGQVESQYSPPPAAVGCALFVDRLPQGQGERDFFSGLTIHPGGDARRVLIEEPAQGIDLMRRIAQKHRNMQAILARKELHDPARFLAQVGDLTAGLEPGMAGDVLFQLAQGYYLSGQWDMASETFQLLTSQHPNHPLSPAALVWQVQYWASGEAAWRERKQQSISSGAGAAQASDAAAPPAALGQVLPEQLAAAGGLRGRAGTALALRAGLEEDRPARASALGKLLEQGWPATYAEPMVRFPLSVAERRQGLHRQAERYYMELTRVRSADAWRACAAGEQWLAEPKDLPPKSMAHAPTGDRPRLDGKLDDAIWRIARPLELHSALGEDSAWPAVALVAYDRGFLYLAVHCRLAPGCRYEPTEGPRPRDPDLSSHDRVDVFLDLDRDWATAYRFSFDHRGWTGDACWQDATWDPTWFVAAQTTDEGWSVEAAIPLEEITGEFPTSRHAWVMGVQRTAPGAGFQSWTEPAATCVMPEGFGYLIFD